MNLTRKIFVLVFSAVLLMLFTQMAYANNDITIIINDTEVLFTDQCPVIVDGRTLVPIRDVFEALGYSVAWNEEMPAVLLSHARSF
ncbi:MAG: copper amine oxidase N-terminal domain-containing protein [Defluviitaleaceae bacterium]|nr:copper amine oxidase N-terminal domain-containing protein [Defluviitaleaceae bacterium]